MKIIRVSNFDLESYAQSVVASGIRSAREGAAMLTGLISTVREGDSTYYRMVEDDYVLWRGMAEFVDETCGICGHPDGSCVG